MLSAREFALSSSLRSCWRFTNIAEGLFVINGVDKEDSYGPLVVGLIDVFEAFLASSIPYLKFDFNILNGDDFDFEVNAYCGSVVGFELIIAESKEDVGFADAAITNNDDFNGEVGIILFLLSLHLILLIWLIVW